MERRIRRLGIVMLLCFVALFVQLNNIQVLRATSLADSPNNPQILAVQRSQPRGDILSADGVNLATSVPTKTGYYKYQRVYNPNTAVPFSQIVGYDTIFGTRTGVEAEYNSFLRSHTRPAKTLRDLLVDRTTTDNVILTINTQLQNQVAGAVDATDPTGDPSQAGGAVVINVKTGSVEAMYSNPTFDPRPLASQNSKDVLAVLQHPPSQQSPEPAGLPDLPVRVPSRVHLQDGDLVSRLRPPAGPGQDGLSGGDLHPAAPVEPPAVQLRPHRPERPGGMRRDPAGHPAPVVRHRLRPVGDGCSGPPA